MAFKASLFFQDPFGYGWTETYNYAGASDQDSIVAALGGLKNVRLGILPSDCSIQYARVGVGTPRFPFTTVFNFGAGQNGQFPNPTLVDFACVIIREQGNLSVNRVFMRGVPADCVSGDQFTPTALWQQYFAAYATYRIGNPNWVLAGKYKSTNQPIAITSLQPTPPRGIQCSTTSSSLPLKNAQVRISGATVPGYNGIKTVTDVTTAGGTSVISMGGASPADAQPAGFNTTLVVLTGYTAQCTDVFPERLSRRSPGRPFGQRPGRRRTLYSLRR
jgi:hypothetical protein